jgi:hypothetical protein
MLRSFAFPLLATIAATASAQTAPSQTAPSQTAPSQTASAQRNAALTAPLPADQAAMKAHVMFLASDAMKGRDAGSPE